MTKEALKLALEALENNRQAHHYCEDTWYSCPKHEDGCANDAEGDECNCGADKANAEIDAAITAIKESLAQPEQEPVVFWDGESRFVSQKTKEWDKRTGGTLGFGCDIALYTTPPQRKPLSDEEIETYRHMIDWTAHWSYINFARAIEAAHGIKE
jgi:hypothetical protein